MIFTNKPYRSYVLIKYTYYMCFYFIYEVWIQTNYFKLQSIVVFKNCAPDTSLKSH